MKLIDNSGFPKFGRFDFEFNEINYKDYKYLNPYGKEIFGLRKKLAYKSFQYLGGISEKLILGVAIADLKFINSAFVYIYDTINKKIIYENFKNLFSFGIDSTNLPGTGSMKFKKRNIKIEMNKTLDSKLLKLNSKNIKLDLEFIEKKIEPLRICTKSGVNSWVYVRKTAGCKMVGKIESELGNFNAEDLSMFGHNDFSLGYMRKETFWNWSFFNSKIEENIIGVNLSSSVNETEFSENSIWINGKLFQLPQVSFIYDKLNLMNEWKIVSSDKSIDLKFIPEGNYKESINAFILGSNFNQLYGKYSGKIKLDIEYKFTNIYGYAEDHYAKW